jgi:hypothetical protein
MSTLQELENINYDLYKDKPEELVTIAKQFLNLKKFEKGIEILEKAIRFSVANNDNDETRLDCAKFYYHYADALIRKCMESDEILAIPNEENGNEGIKEEKEEEEDSEDDKDSKTEKVSEKEKIIKNVENGQPVVNNFKNSNPNHKSNIEVIIEQQKKNSRENEESEDNEEDGDIVVNDAKEDLADADEYNLQAMKDESDESVAYENLFFAENIYKNFLEKYDKEDPAKLKTQNPSIITHYFELSNVYQKFGELEMCKSDFKSAIEFFQKALDIRKKYDDKFSRAIAELYFNMATTFDFDSRKCLLSYYKTKIIMEYHLKQELIKINLNSIADKIVIREDDLESQEIKIFNLFTNRNVIEKIPINDENLSKNEDIEELHAIISELNMKIEDVLVDIQDYEKYMREKSGLQQNQNQFTTDYDKSKLVDVTNLGIVKKRSRQEEKPDQLEKEEGGKRAKIENSDENEINKKEK